MALWIILVCSSILISLTFDLTTLVLILFWCLVSDCYLHFPFGTEMIMLYYCLAVSVLVFNVSSLATYLTHDFWFRTNSSTWHSWLSLIGKEFFFNLWQILSWYFFFNLFRPTMLHNSKQTRSHCILCQWFPVLEHTMIDVLCSLFLPHCSHSFSTVALLDAHL